MLLFCICFVIVWMWWTMSQGDRARETESTRPAELSQLVEAEPIECSSANVSIPGMYHFENVCIGPDNMTFYGDPLQPVQLPIKLRFNGLERYSTVHSSQWMHDARHGVWAAQDTLYFQKPYGGNPAHCLMDIFFSVVRGIALSNDSRRPSFAWYTTPRGEPACAHDPDKQNWCCFVATKLNLIDPTKAAAVPDGERQQHCFRELWMPMQMENRFPIDWTQPDFVGNTALIRKYANWSSDRGPQTTEYPKRKLEQMQSILHRSVLNENPMQWETGYGGQQTILLLDRTWSNWRRKWLNANETAAMIKQQFGRHNLVHYGKGYNELKPQQQAELFSSAHIIISPHGAQLANLIFARVGTKVLELTDTQSTSECEGAPLMSPDISVQSEATHDEWWGCAGMFTFSRRIGIEHFVFGSSPPFHHNYADFTTDAEYIKHFLVTRAHLKPDEATNRE